MKRVKWNGKGRNCQTGCPSKCLAASFDGVICMTAFCAITEEHKENMNPKTEKKEDEKPARLPRPNRKRHARWRGVLGGVLYHFEYSPVQEVVTIWKHRSRKKRVISMTDLLHLLEGQKMLPL